MDEVKGRRGYEQAMLWLGNSQVSSVCDSILVQRCCKQKAWWLYAFTVLVEEVDVSLAEDGGVSRCLPLVQ